MRCSLTKASDRDDIAANRNNLILLEIAAYYDDMLRLFIVAYRIHTYLKNFYDFRKYLVIGNLSKRVIHVD